MNIRQGVGAAAAFALALALVATVLGQSILTGTATRDGNLRAGPGTTYALVGSLDAGAAVTVTEKSAAGDWYKLDNGKWVAAFLVEIITPTVKVGSLRLATPTSAAKPAGSGATATATKLPAATRTPVKTPTATPLVAVREGEAIALENANLREGPGTSYAIIGSLKDGDYFKPVGRDSGLDWIQTESGAWVSADLVAGLPVDLPVTAVPAQLPGGNPTPVPAVAVATDVAAAPAATPAGWQVEVNGINFSSDCPCGGNTLNCPDFAIPKDAQACYLRCKEMVGYDVHALDRDKDGTACEWSW